MRKGCGSTCFVSCRHFFPFKIEESDLTSQVENVDLVILRRSVRSVPRNSDFARHRNTPGREGRTKAERRRRIIPCSAKPWQRPGHTPTRTLAQESSTPFGRCATPLSSKGYPRLVGGLEKNPGRRVDQALGPGPCRLKGESKSKNRTHVTLAKM